jgi:hypothetical protein
VLETGRVSSGDCIVSIGKVLETGRVSSGDCIVSIGKVLETGRVCSKDCKLWKVRCLRQTVSESGHGVTCCTTVASAWLH